MAYRHTKNYYTSLAIEEMQMKTLWDSISLKSERL